MRHKLLPPGKRGPFFYLRGSHSGRRFEVSTGTKDRPSAEKFAADYVAAILRDRLLAGAQVQGPVTFGTAAAAYIAFREPRKDDKMWVEQLSAWVGHRLVEDLRHADLVAAAAELLPGRANATKNRNVIGPASAVLHYAAEQGWCAYRRFRRFPVSRRSPRQPAPDAVMMKLLGTAEGHQRLFLAMLYETGLRVTDLLRLEEEHLDLAGSAILARVSKTADRIRILISPPLVAMLATTPRSKNCRVFPWGDRHNVYRWLRPLCAQLKVSYTPHQSRHALATDLLRRGIPDKQAAEHGAWADPRSLHRYQHAAPAMIEGRSFENLMTPKRGKRRRKVA
jgi:integrase